MCMTYAVNGKFVLAAWYVVLSAFCDALDGFMARLTNSASDFGVELDSLADVVSFGVAPTIFAYILFLDEFGPLGMILAASPLIFGALRLARFNVQLVGFTKDYFSGMPIPLSALIITSFAVFVGPERIVADELYQYLYIGVIALNAILMVSTIRYPVFPKFSKYEFKNRPVRTALFIAAGIIIIATLGKALFPVLFIIGISGPVGALIRKIMRKPAELGEHDTEEDAEELIDPVTLDSH
jgi:CDP-diacylglycerol---serine O-phosphatidyltransferase